MLPPTGQVTLLFTDIEGSTVLWETEPVSMAKALARHDEILRRSIERNGGFVFKTVGDAFCAAFASPRAALSSCLQSQLQLQSEAWTDGLTIRVRMSLHTGSPQLRDDDYFGPPVNRVARTLSLAHGEQVLLTQGTVEVLKGDLPAKVELEDLGVHKLKDIDNFMLIHPDLRSDFPKLRSTEIRSHNLPELGSSFVGREREILQVSQLIRENQVVTLIGAGGTGKSRLAIKVGHESLEFYPDGVWLVDLSSLSDPEFIDQEIATVLGVREVPGRPIRDTLTQFLSKREMLVVLDNTEHLTKGVSEIVDAIVQVNNRVRFLATAREPLRNASERIFRVPSLSLPGDREVVTPENIMQFEATRLFVERARQAQPALELTATTSIAIASICRQVDGIAFAIELAATRARTMTIEQIDVRIQDRLRLLASDERSNVSRRQTLRAMLDWSYGLLDDAEKAALNRLSAFSGGFSTQAAEAVLANGSYVGTQIEDWEVIDLLTRLADKSLVVAGNAFGEHRYKLLETVRQYSKEMLEANGETTLVADEHLRFFTQYAETSEDKLQGPDQAEWLDRLEEDHDNLRVAIQWCLQSSESVQNGYRLTGAIGRFWSVRGYFHEGRALMDRVLAAHPEAVSIERATACRTAGQIAYWQGDSVAGRKYGEESLTICRQLGDTQGETISLFRLGFATLSDQDYSSARSYFEQALELAIRIDYSMGMPHLLNALGEVSLAEKTFDQAKTYFEQALEKFSEFDDRRSIASVMKNLATVAIQTENFGEARRLLSESLEIRRDLGNENGITRTLDTFSILLSKTGGCENAAILMGAVEELNKKQGGTTEASDQLLLAEAQRSCQLSVGPGVFAEHMEQGRGFTLDQACEFALTHAAPGVEAVAGNLI